LGSEICKLLIVLVSYVGYGGEHADGGNRGQAFGHPICNLDEAAAAQRERIAAQQEHAARNAIEMGCLLDIGSHLVDGIHAERRIPIGPTEGAGAMLAALSRFDQDRCNLG